MVIANDLIIPIDDYITNIVKEHFYFFGYDMTIQEKCNELAYLVDKCALLGIHIKTIKPYNKKYIQIEYIDSLNRKHLIQI